MIEFCAGSGKFHTNNPNTKKPKPLLTLSYQAIQQLVDNPQNIPDKHAGYWVIPSTLLSRNKEEQEKNGLYPMLWVDIDKNPHGFDNLPDITHGCQFESYTTKTATEENQKARILIPISQAINANDFSLYQEIFNDKLIEKGIETDPKNCGYNQIFYTPNRGEIYKTNSQREGGLFDPVSAWTNELAEKKAINKQQEIEAEERTKLKATYAPVAGDTPINNFNRSHTVESVLLSAGYKQRGNKFCHPDSETGNYAASVNDDNRVMTKSSKDKLHTIPEMGHNAFSAFSVLFHGGNTNEAIKATIGDTVSDWKKELKQAVAEINKKYAYVTVGGKSRILQWKYDYDLKRYYPDYIDKTAFIDGFANVSVPVGSTESGKLKYKPLGSAWFTHSERTQYLEGVYFKPMVSGNFQVHPNRLNMWTGYAVEPEIGDKHQPILNHLFNLVCEGNNEYYQYLIKWIAWVLQHPDKQPEVAIVLRGGKGTGKGQVGRLLQAIFGKHGLHLAHASHLVGKFNSHLADCAFIFSDEATYAGDKQGEQVLKGLVTEPTFTVERKGIDIVTEKNNLAILMATNHEWAVPTSKDERRYFILDVEQKKDKTYYAELDKACNEGKSNFLKYCLSLNLIGYHPREYPETDGNRQQRELSLDLLPRFLLEACERGYLIEHYQGLDNKWHPYDDLPSLVTINLIHEALEQWGNKSKRLDKYNIVSTSEITKYLKNLGLAVSRQRNGWDYSKDGVKITNKQLSSVHLGKIEGFEMLVRNFEKL